ncbi:hypothetical protein AAFF_G00323820 [Aldrovandia affinis]|uniref:PiggyBac transposable element-derived protein domain-containing protein n=1 Tax=Aldrovandia affinis TaxID=143900 RepID=A0AAD7W020_9TELE|nr:hypothetical protein AAFF_G00323820 [Aldrovandia affinis]
MATFSAQDCLQSLMESDEDNNSSCPDTDEELEEERQHYELRIDPAEDLTDDDDDDAEHKAPTPPQVATEKPCRTRRKSGTRAPLLVSPKKPGRIHTPASQASRHPPWKTETAPDEAPPVSRFQPARPPGVQLNSAENHTPLDLFKLYVTRDAVNTLCENTNKQAAKAQAKGSKYTWTDVGVEEFYRYIGLLFYMAMVKLHDIRDYWRQNSIFSCPFPATIISRDRYRAISWNVHMSDPDKDQENDRRRGTPQYDKLFRLRPFMDTVQHACKTFFHPRRNISVDERMVAWKANSGMTQYIKAKPIKWGFKLFVLCDSSTGYTVNFSVYPGKNYFQIGQGYDTVMSLVNRDYLGSGYHVYMDNFYTSPKLFRDLLALNIGACGTYRDHRKDCPRTESNALTQKSPRGSIRWIRDGPLVFVKWVDTKVVAVCSTIHAAFAGDTAERRVKQDGVWISKDLPCPSPIIHYNKHMGGVDLSDQLIQYYTAQHKTMKWYRKLFLHFLDIAAINAYLLHKELSSLGQREAMTHKAFQEALTAQLCGVSQKVPRKRATYDHVPVPTGKQTVDVGKRATLGRKKCVLCKMCTPWECEVCDMPLCLQLTRNCFATWHQRL